MIAGLQAVLVGVAWVPIALSDAGPAKGVAWIDADADGDLDVVVSRGINGRVLWVNDGRAAFAPIQPEALAALGADGLASVWADVDDDGDADAYLVNGGGGRLIRNDAGAFTDVTAPPLDDRSDGQGATWGDYDLDGDLDLYVVNRASPGALLRNDGACRFADVTNPPLDDAGLSSSAEWVDVDLDGDVDLHLVTYGADRLFRNDEGAFADVTTGPLGDASAGSGASWGDYDGDGDPDVFVANLGASRLLRNDGACVFADVTTAPLVAAGFATGSAWEDADSDGDLDLYVANQGGASHWFRNHGGAFVDATEPPLDGSGSAQGVAWADADGSGSPDLLVTDSGGANRLLLNFTGAGNRWIDVRLVGTVSNLSAVGARVRATAGGKFLTRWVTSGSGSRSHGSRVVHFGLGAAPAVDGIEVAWPSGIVQTVSAPPVDALLVIVERDPADAAAAAGTSDAPPSVGGKALAAAPPSFRFTTAISYELALPGTVELLVLDPAGRAVRTLVAARVEAGRHHELWNGRDDRGATVAPGTYFVRLEVGTLRGLSRIAKLR
jgi:hypothetical protein